ncbi:diguanylate cyclase (GGDEF)-like protein [Kineococcus radiotolerans]|uniref:Diguanylate cyclase (GGDEF)-like protein n=1 Tax=Kineococcus radiotolerans TaxID=131568 RepID=A0A7W4XX16_KINRA|nr:diguanylate cyclase [Kineococcus radiotolerans]MBB2900754.1 diguanylate cyclase (GGDEF)-like protein [Kineococcus radiotolerans]
MRGRSGDRWAALGAVRAGLRPFPPDLEPEYRAARNAARSRYLVPTALLGICCLDLYVLVDLVLAPQVVLLSLLLRLAVVTPAMLAALVVRRWRLRRDPASGVDGPLFAGAAALVVAVLVLIQGTAPGALGGAYFAGSFIVVVFFVTLLRSDVRQAAAGLVAMLAAFGHGQALIGADPVPLQVAALLAVAVAGFFGLVMAGHVETSERARFLAERRERALARERERLIAALATAAVRDELTGLLNRRGLHERLPAPGTPVAVLVVDVDHFKSYNDRFGHLEGDRCLARVAAALEAGSRPGDVVARTGGEEFVVLLHPDPGAPGGRAAQRADARAAAERLHAAVRALALPHPARPDGPGVVTVSVGVALGSWDEAFAAADAAVYAAKHAGRDRVHEAPGAPEAPSAREPHEVTP